MVALFKRVSRLMDEAQLSSAARAIRQERLTYLTPRKLRRLEAALDRVLRQNVAGDVAEFGMALGGSGILLASGATRAGRRFHGFDVFGMIPPPTSDRDDEKSKARYQKIASGQSNGLGDDVYYGYRENLYDDVCRSFAKYGLAVDGKNVLLHRGLFEETWSSAGIDRIAFAHIDCDWFDPVRFCLENVSPRLSPGGVMVIDDYHDYGGCRAAADEFLAAHADFRLEDGENALIRRIQVSPPPEA